MLANGQQHRDEERQPHLPHLRHLPAAAAAAILLLAFARIHTYVTAQDPFWYVALARQVLTGRVVNPELAPGLFFVSPGFPLLLAGLIRVCGAYAPYFLNITLGIGFVLVYAALMRRCFPRHGNPGVYLGLLLLIILGGYTYHAHFLLYPFRGMPKYFLILLGHLLVLRWQREDAPARLALASIPFAVAAAIREPAVFGLAGAALCLALDRQFPLRVRAHRLAWFLAPLFAAAGLLLIAGWALGRPINHQILSWSQRLLQQPVPQLAEEALLTGRTMGGFLLRAATVPGVLLLAWGLWSARANRAALCLFLVPAVLFYLFYCLYIPHWRYFLTVLVFLSPFFGAGLADLLRRTTVRLPRAAAILPRVATVLLLAAAAVSANRLEPWGRKVTKQEVRALRRDIESLTPQVPALYIDRRCRYLGDALMCFTESTLPDPYTVRDRLDAGDPCFYLQALDDGCYYESYLDGTLADTTVDAETALRYAADLLPVGKQIVFAGGTFAVYQVLPWSELRTRTYAEVATNRNTVVWLDFGDRDPEPVHVRIHASGNQTVGEFTTGWGRQIQGFALPADQVFANHFYISLQSDTPIPRDTLIGIRSGPQPMPFPLNRSRRLSTHAWTHPPFSPQPLSAPFAAILDPDGTLTLPIPRGNGYNTLTITLVLDPTTLHDTPAQGRLTATLDGTELLDSPFPLHQRGTHIAIEAPRPSTHTLSLHLASHTSPHTPIVIRQVAILPTTWIPADQ
jgi:hypothetical protein